jgi:hypothetical protein
VAGSERSLLLTRERNLALGVMLALVGGCQAPAREPHAAVVQVALDEALEMQGGARVIINLAQAPPGWPEHERHAAMLRAQLNLLQRARSGLRFLHQFKHVPAVVGVLSRDAWRAAFDVANPTSCDFANARIQDRAPREWAAHYSCAPLVSQLALADDTVATPVWPARLWRKRSTPRFAGVPLQAPTGRDRR